MFEPYVRQWNLRADGEPIITPGSRLLPVRHGTKPAMLKIALDAEEKIGNQLMTWWDGDGAAQVYAHAGDALLMERAEGPRSLLHMAMHGEDDEASRIICAAVARLHVPRPAPLPPLVDMRACFRSLPRAARLYGGMFEHCQHVAEHLVSTPRDEAVLHGDIHHNNILDFGPRGWLAIDPKRVMGERTFDYANLICNPDLPSVTDPARFTRQVRLVADVAGLERQRLLLWVLAFAGLSAAWFLEDGHQQSAAGQLAVAKLAASAIDNGQR
ncbi:MULTISPECIES: aminoglycoside phosphotransferase family protein [unclassified Pseudomonas]|uniref:aminoglycoside phosphotransferase family protein n=1 Tax=unclassified Pseudomonas TaxID=196821 RepID=UPI000B845CAC|nr:MULTISPECIES: aminoglycoside phosphotransferase family protein [unclassified Pseudomonas]